jgi:GT2 family glycosyltransferase
MKIAAITVTYNDHYKVTQWFDYYSEYKNEISLHIIVDNGSDADFIKTIEKLFPNSIIIKRTCNGGCTAAYNDGIRYALNVKEVDSIMLIGNDIRIPADSISVLHNILFSNERYGIITPILFRKDSDIIHDYGSTISQLLYMNPSHSGERLHDALPLIKEVKSVTGGMNIAKREYYETIGLQDEKLFMYSDEVDMGLRMAKTRFKAVITRRATAWHQHIAPPNVTGRQGYAEFFMRRNKIYLAYKHYGVLRAVYIFCFQLARSPLKAVSFVKHRAYTHIVYYLLGCFCGILRIKRNFRFIIDNRI